jgi:hypothetical protein
LIAFNRCSPPLVLRFYDQRLPLPILIDLWSQNEIIKSQLRLHVRRWASCLNDITDFDGRSTAQEADSVGPVPFGGFSQKIAQGPYEATRIRWRYSLFVNKNHSAMLSLFFRPSFEQRGNRPTIVGNKRQPLHGCLLQAGSVLLS